MVQKKQKKFETWIFLSILLRLGMNSNINSEVSIHTCSLNKLLKEDPYNTIHSKTPTKELF